LIFVSVGTLDRPFDRLIAAVDAMAYDIKEKIIVQIGHSKYRPHKCEFFEFCSNEEMLAYISASSTVISHSGFGIIGNAIHLNKPLILVPREIRFGEAIDKQYELAEYLSAENESIFCVRDTKDLFAAVEAARNITVQYRYKTTIPNLISNFIKNTFH